MHNRTVANNKRLEGVSYAAQAAVRGGGEGSEVRGTRAD